jgi:hypothetical protein
MAQWAATSPAGFPILLGHRQNLARQLARLRQRRLGQVREPQAPHGGGQLRGVSQARAQFASAKIILPEVGRSEARQRQRSAERHAQRQLLALPIGAFRFLFNQRQPAVGQGDSLMARAQVSRVLRRQTKIFRRLTELPSRLVEQRDLRRRRPDLTFMKGDHRFRQRRSERRAPRRFERRIQRVVVGLLREAIAHRQRAIG